MTRRNDKYAWKDVQADIIDCPKNTNDLSGRAFGLLTVRGYIGRHPTKKTSLWKCDCSCGGVAITFTSQLTSGVCRSCGCLVGQHKTHGESRSITYESWRAMLKRCLNKNHHAYARYGGRGITVCDQWVKSFETFLDDMGHRPSLKHQLDRINNDGMYVKSNCRWATSKQNNNNKQVNIRIEAFGKVMTVREWSEEFGVAMNAIRNRIKTGWNAEDAVTTPVVRSQERPEKSKVRILPQ